MNGQKTVRKKSKAKVFFAVFGIIVWMAALAAVGYYSFKSGLQTRLEKIYEPIEINVIGGVESKINHLRESSFAGLKEISKVRIIDRDKVEAPVPKAENFKATMDKEEVNKAIEQAKQNGLAADSDFVWNDRINTYADDPYIRYYVDSSICTVLWKEEVNGCVYNFVDVAVAHPTQFRRYLTNDKFGRSNLELTTKNSAKVNALVGMSGDFYAYRDIGVVVYKQKLFRNNADVLEICFIDSKGDMSFGYKMKDMSDEEVQKYIDENDIEFSLSFGPVLIDDGKLHERAKKGYPIGEVNDKYSRAAIAQMGSLHYLLCTVDGGVDQLKGTTAMNVGRELLKRGCKKAYTLDGGRTGTIYHNGKLFNRIGYGPQREISDIIYFATAE